MNVSFSALINHIDCIELILIKCNVQKNKPINKTKSLKSKNQRKIKGLKITIL